MDKFAVPLKTRQKRLGHAQIETTLTHYTHPTDDADFEVAERFDAVLRPITKLRANINDSATGTNQHAPSEPAIWPALPIAQCGSCSDQLVAALQGNGK